MPITTASTIVNTHFNRGIEGLADAYPHCTYEELTDLVETAWETLEAEGC